MRPHVTCIVLIALTLGLAGGVRADGPAPDPGAVPQIAVLVGWDGAQRAHVRESLERGELPTLAWLAETGALIDVDIEGTTDTKAGWTQILTGYLPEVTGVWSNRKFQPIPAGLSVFERLEAHFGAETIFTGGVIGKTSNVGNAPPQRRREDAASAPAARGRKKKAKRKPGRIVIENGVRWRVIPGEPYFLTQRGMDLFENGLKYDDVVARRAMDLIEKHRESRVFLFVHFAEVDHSGHQHGENSPEYDAALVSNDYWTGRIIEKLRELGLWKRAVLYVTADHGFDEGAKQHRNAPHVFLASNDASLRGPGKRQDVAPTILRRLGVPLDALDPPVDGSPLTSSGRRRVRTPFVPAKSRH